MNLCELEVSPGMQCLDPAPETIRVRDRVTGLTTVVFVCEKHKADHNRKAAGVRHKSKK